MRAVRASLLARAGSAAAVAVLATGGVLATAGAASGGKNSNVKLPTTLHISDKVIAHNHHRADAVTGVLRSNRKPVAAETVTLEWPGAWLVPQEVGCDHDKGTTCCLSAMGDPDGPAADQVRAVRDGLCR